MTGTDELRRNRRLEQAIVLSFIAHGAASLAMALLAPMLPGGGSDDATRVALVAAQPWRFHLGWLPWHLAALASAWLAVATLRARWPSRPASWLAALLMLTGVALDQGGQILWETRGVALAAEAHRSGDLAPYLALERQAYLLVAAWAALFYTLAGVAQCAAFARVFTPALARLSVVTFSLFSLLAAGPLLPPGLAPPPAAVAAGNALAFALLLAWLAALGERVMRRSHSDTPHGRWAPWRAPRPHALAGLLELAANSRFARALCEWLPVLEFRSDITDVIYVNYVVPREQLEPYVPEGLEIQPIGPGGRFALFTFLTYQHGHFGPSIAGPLRALFPSPVQSNWRTYVRDPRTGREGIYFVTNAVTTTLHSLGARLMAEGAPMHLASGSLTRSPDGAVALDIDPGQGNAPDVHLRLAPDPSPRLPAPFDECFESYEAMLRYAVPQDRAMSTQPWRGMTTRQEISLGIPTESCEPLAGQVRSRAAERIVGSATPLCFRVPRVPFRLIAEEHDHDL